MWSFRHLSMPAFIYSGNCNSLLQDIRLCAFYEALPPEKQKKKKKKEKKVRRREKRNEKKRLGHAWSNHTHPVCCRKEEMVCSVVFVCGRTDLRKRGVSEIAKGKAKKISNIKKCFALIISQSKVCSRARQAGRQAGMRQQSKTR